MSETAINETGMAELEQTTTADEEVTSSDRLAELRSQVNALGRQTRATARGMRPTLEGEENIPDGAAVLAFNAVAPVHLLRVKLGGRSVRFVGSGRSATQDALAALDRGELVALMPEGGRSPDGRLYRGDVLVAELVLASGAPVVPVAAVDQGTLKGRLLAPHLVVGEPVDVDRFRDLEVADGPLGSIMLRSVTDLVMARLRALSGQVYMDLPIQARKQELLQGRKAKGRAAREAAEARKAAEQARIQQRRADRAAEAAEIAEARARAVEAARARSTSTG